MNVMTASHLSVNQFVGTTGSWGTKYVMTETPMGRQAALTTAHDQLTGGPVQGETLHQAVSVRFQLSNKHPLK